VAPARRALFRTVGLGVGAAGAAVAGLEPATAEAAATRPDGSLGYRETEHVKKAYDTARF
jgi:hypothetical protein